MTNAIVTDWTLRCHYHQEGALVHQFGKLGLVVGFALIGGPILGSRIGQLDHQKYVLVPVYISLACVVAAFLLV